MAAAHVRLGSNLGAHYAVEDSTAAAFVDAKVADCIPNTDLGVVDASTAAAAGTEGVAAAAGGNGGGLAGGDGEAGSEVGEGMMMKLLLRLKGR